MRLRGLAAVTLFALLAMAGTTAASDPARCSSCASCSSRDCSGKTGIKGKCCRCINRIIDWFDELSCGAGKTHLDLGCTGVRADCIFVFGNCCQFFGEEPWQPVHSSCPIYTTIPPHTCTIMSGTTIKP